MATPSVRFRLPDGRSVRVGPDALVGRSPAAVVRVEDPRVSTIHAELSWRETGFVLLARGGRLLVGGRPRAEVPLAVGMEIVLAPGLTLSVDDLTSGDAPVIPSTAGRERLTFEVEEHRVIVKGPGNVAVEIAGRGAAILRILLDDRSALAWDGVAERAWPEDGGLRAASTAAIAAGTRLGPGAWTEVDERRFRNRWDQQVVLLRRTLEPLRNGQLLRVQAGLVELVLHGGDEVVAR
ncbi:MAG: hypothetical protein Q8P41_12755 [Pseudomonadota bacterium]|nr:hypothetical protein [Pseudomonadota bacterium]